MTGLLIGCGTKTSTTDAETFDDFLKEFSSDSLFQIERVKFPLALVAWDNNGNHTTEKINRENWRHLRLDEFLMGDEGYTKETKIYTDSAKIELRGIDMIDNDDKGIDVDYVFRKVDGQWTLMIKREYSD